MSFAAKQPLALLERANTLLREHRAVLMHEDSIRCTIETCSADDRPANERPPALMVAGDDCRCTEANRVWCTRCIDEHYVELETRQWCVQCPRCKQHIRQLTMLQHPLAVPQLWYVRPQAKANWPDPVEDSDDEEECSLAQ